ncbi:MAG: sulfotransferase family protein [Actinomycetota bacterium]
MSAEEALGPVDRPVFVIGTGRSGLSPVMDLIAYHRAFAWPSQYNDRWPGAPRVSALSRVVDLPPLDSALKHKRGVPKHAECYRLWNRCFPGFAEPFRDLRADDVTPRARDLFRKAVGGIMAHQGKSMFIAEYSGWSRIGFLREVFPGARFIHVVRDGRAVAHSYTTIDWWNGWEGIHRWRLGVPDDDVLVKLERYRYSFLALAAVYWKILIDNIIEASRPLPADDVLVVRYEDLVADPFKQATRCIEFCGLSDDARFRRHVRTVRIVDANNITMRIPPWRDSVDRAQVEMMNDLIGEELVQLGYL